MKTNKMNNKKFFNLKDYVEANYGEPLDKEAIVNYPLLYGAVSLVKSTIFDKTGMQNTDEFIIKDVASGLTCCYCDIADASHKNPLIRVIVLPMGAEISDNTIFFLSDASERYILSNGLEYCFYTKDNKGITLCADINLQKCSVEDIEFMSKISTESFAKLVSGNSYIDVANSVREDAMVISDEFVDFLRGAVLDKTAAMGPSVEFKLLAEFVGNLIKYSDDFAEFLARKSDFDDNIEVIKDMANTYLDSVKEGIAIVEGEMSADELWDSSEYDEDEEVVGEKKNGASKEDIIRMAIEHILIEHGDVIDEGTELVSGILNVISEDEDLNSLLSAIAEEEGVEVTDIIDNVLKSDSITDDEIASLGDFWGSDETFEGTEDVKVENEEEDKVVGCSLDDIKKIAGCKASKMVTSAGKSIPDLLERWKELESKKQFAGVSILGKYYQTYDIIKAVQVVMDGLVDIVGIGKAETDKRLNKLINSVVRFDQPDSNVFYIPYRGKFILGVSDIEGVLCFMRQASRVLKKYCAMNNLDNSMNQINLVFNKKADVDTLSEKQKKNQVKGTIDVGTYYRIGNMKQKWVQNKTTGFTPCKFKIAVAGTTQGEFDVSSWGDMITIAIKYAEEKFGGTEMFCNQMMGKSDLIHYTYDEFKKHPEHVIPTKNIKPVLWKGTDCNFYYNQSRKNTQVVSFLKKFEETFGLKLFIRFKAQ